MKINNYLFLTFLFLTACSSSPMKGTWQYDGGVYNGKPRKAAEDFKMFRTYTWDSYEGHLIEGDIKTRYTAGKYEIRKDSVYLTSTFSSQPSQLLNRTQAYEFKVEDSRLTIRGTLPNGMQVEEYWKQTE